MSGDRIGFSRWIQPGVMLRAASACWSSSRFVNGGVSLAPMSANEAGFLIHSCMHAARPEINCVIHTHTRSGVAVSAMKCGLLPISQHAMRVHAEITYHDYEGVALYKEEQARMARDLGKKSKAMILRNHGVLSLGETVREAFEIMYYLDCACQIQVDAMAGGLQHVQLMSDAAAESSTQALQPP